jgi:hypothetical protein
MGLLEVDEGNNWLTDSVEQSPWKADNSLPSGQIHRVLWNPMAHYRTQKSPLLVPILSQINPVHSLQTHLCMI